MTEIKGNKYELSWRAAFKAYSLKDLLWDSILPILITVILFSITVMNTGVDKIKMIDKMCSLLFIVLPPLLSILIASFSIWISFFLSKTFEKLENNEEGRMVVYGLNASFLINILFMLIGMIFVIITTICQNFELSLCPNTDDIINHIVLFVLYFMSIEYIWLLKDIAKNLHNVAKFALLFR